MSDFSDIGRVLRGLLSGLQSQETMNTLGLAGIRKIQDRTRRGVDVSGRPFKPYSESWADKRERMGLPTHVVNLTVDDISGMMHQIDHKVAANFKSVSIDVNDARKRKIASYHDKLGVGKAGANIRHFWGLTDDDEKEIAELTGEKAQDLLDDLTRETGA